MKNKLYTFQEDGVSFKAAQALNFKTMYFPLCGTQAQSLKSSISPYLSGDIKTDKYHYLTKPVSTQDLRLPLRNFYFHVSNESLCSLAQTPQSDEDNIEAGLLWHQQTRFFPKNELKTTILNFIPVSGETVELMRVTVQNPSSQPISFTPTAAIPLFARSLANKHDHEHVTSLLHRIQQMEQGVVVTPTMVFNEEGHLANEEHYFVLGCAEDGSLPVGSFPTVDSFYGDAGDIFEPVAVIENHAPKRLSDRSLQGQEAMGALRFQEQTLKPGESFSYLVMVGMESSLEKALDVFKQFSTPFSFTQALEENQKYWLDKTSTIGVQTGNPAFNAWMRWVVLQPILRRIYGCSFLPDHDYGKGGKGWRDIWQDLLSLILIEPDQVRNDLINNFGGVRIDGSNATIIGNQPGEFIADRNDITRVWMDHGVWPLSTLKLYIDQTGDLDILLEKKTYFRDKQLSRNFRRDQQWNEVYGQALKDIDGIPYEGTLLEHLLVQTLIPFFNVGEHNHFRLESADWNDGLDMAFERGESVTFGSFYAGNLIVLADLLDALQRIQGITHISLAKELGHLFSFLNHHLNYDDGPAKKDLLFDVYFPSVEPEISGEKMEVLIQDLSQDLREKGRWVFDHIQKTEMVQVDGQQWFNGYYDNQGQRVEGKNNGRIRMTLTGQVFPVMSGCASEEGVAAVVKAVNAYLLDKTYQGYRLNSDFGVRHYLDLGRAFGFAFGTKENGAFFSHMTVMYANALYKRGFAREGFKVLNSIYRMSEDSMTSKIYPGVPEYFDAEGRGMYHYLTGSASWFVLTMVTQVFGIRGDMGDLVLAPQLVREQFHQDGVASIESFFAGKRITCIYRNAPLKDVAEYKIQDVRIDGESTKVEGLGSAKVCLPRKDLLKAKDRVQIEVILE